MRNSKRKGVRKLQLGINAVVLQSINVVKGDYGLSLALAFSNGYDDWNREITSVRDWNLGADITDRNHPDFINAEDNLAKKLIDLVLAYVDEEVWDTAFVEALQDRDELPCEEFFNLVKDIILNSEKFKKKAFIDVFAQFPYKADNTPATDLEIPRDGRHGMVFSKHVPAEGEWVNVAEKGMTFQDSANNIHPITRSKKFRPEYYIMELNEDEGDEFLSL